MKYLSLIFLFIAVSSSSCKKKENSDKKEVETTSASTALLEASFDNTDLLLPEGFSYNVLFSADRDSVTVSSGKKYPAKGMQDLIVFIPSSDDRGKIYISHEALKIDDHLGDGGGGTLFDIEKSNGEWQVAGEFNHVDFAPVGGTIRNCGGTLTPHGTVLTAEEIDPPDNASVYLEGAGFRDTSDFNGLKRWQNMGYLVEIDPSTGKVIQKLYAAGRFEPEDVQCMPDGKTIYITDDHDPAVFFKFIADRKGDYSKGQLYAYKQSSDGESGEWLPLPKEREALIHARKTAVALGATLFIRHEWLEIHDGKLYISETGSDAFDWHDYVRAGGVPAKHLDQFKGEGMNFSDYYGRILMFDLETNKMSVFLEGGPAENDTDKVFAQPDCITKVKFGKKTYLVINEDMNRISEGERNEKILLKTESNNEIFLLNLDIKNPTVDDLIRFAVVPKGAEPTGSIFTPDGKAMFVNIQHPDQSNPPPFDRSCTVVISGFENFAH